MADEKKPSALIAFLESSKKGGAPSEEKEPAEEEHKPSAGELSAARDILAAIKADDAEALCKALYAHSEVRDLGPDSEEEEV